MANGATYLLFAASLIVGVIYVGAGRDYWTVAKWSGIGAPVVATILTLCLLSTGWMLGMTGGSDAALLPRLRLSTALWILLGIELPWIVAWIGADATGAWFQSWWQHAHHGEGPGVYVWGIRLMGGLITYALASAIGVLATFLIDMRLTAHPGANH